MSESVSRRRFLIQSGCATACAAAVPACGAEESTTTVGGSPDVEPIGDASKYPDSTRMPTMPTDGSMPTCPGTGTYTLGPMASNIGLNQRVQVSGNLYVTRDSQGIYAIDIACTHAGCPINYVPETSTWVCPCHGSRFQLDGTFIAGPAGKNLRRYFACKGSDGLIRIDMSKLV